MESPEHYAQIAMRNVRRSDANATEVFALLAVAAAVQELTALLRGPDPDG